MDLQPMMKMVAKTTHTPNIFTSSQDFHIEFAKSVIDLKKARIISKWEISKRNVRTAAVVSKRVPPVQNKGVGTYALRCYYGDNIKHGLLQNICFKERINILVEKLSK